jgi:hypothetical protein
MARNRYFNQYAFVKQEQKIIHDLVSEAIKIYGIDGYYIPRTQVNLDEIYGEDGLVKYEDALSMEMYVKSFDGFQGQEDFLSKFGLQIDESITFLVAQHRFIESLKPLINTEYGYNIRLEDDGYLIDTQTYDYTDILRPREGDLIWIPLLGYMYEIKFTENIENFYQLGDIYTFEMRCDRFEYSSEKLDTGVADIDAIEDVYSLSTDNIEKILNETDSSIFALEDGTRLLAEGDTIIPFEVAADNEAIGKKIIDGDVLDFSEKNPFALTRTY